MDVVYHPWPTPLAAGRRGAPGSVVASGFAMLLHQAAAQVELMTGKPAPLEAMRAAGEAELARRRLEPPAPRPGRQRSRRSASREASAAVRSPARPRPALPASPRSRSPAITPATSATGRFWLSFALASMRVISSSRPTMARSCPSMKARGASSTDHGRAWYASCLAVRRRTTDSVHAASSWTISSPVARARSRSSRSAPPVRARPWTRTTPGMMYASGPRTIASASPRAGSFHWGLLRATWPCSDPCSRRRLARAARRRTAAWSPPGPRPSASPGRPRRGWASSSRVSRLIGREMGRNVHMATSLPAARVSLPPGLR